MVTKTELVAEIIRELRRAPTVAWSPPAPGPVDRITLPPTLPVSPGRELKATDELLEAIRTYSSLWLANTPSIKPRFQDKEFTHLVRDAFAKTLVNIDLDWSDQDATAYVRKEVETKIRQLIERNGRLVQLALGCHAIRNAKAYPLRIGPVTFELRDRWLQLQLESGRLSAISARRLARHWNGEKLRPRKASEDKEQEDDIMRAIGPCKTVCTVETLGLSEGLIESKGVLAARLALTALSLTWQRPSRALFRMNLHFDGVPHRRNAVSFAADRMIRSVSYLSMFPDDHWADDNHISLLRDYQNEFDQIGEALKNYVQPTTTVTRPNLMNVLFLSLMWFHEACRETVDQIAVTKFAACLDVLANGEGDSGIEQFIKAQMGHSASDQLMVDGRTTRYVVEQIYKEGRSRLIHGNSKNFTHDWTTLRGTGEAVARDCLVAACTWMTEHPDSDDPSALSVSEEI